MTGVVFAGLHTPCNGAARWAVTFRIDFWQNTDRRSPADLRSARPRVPANHAMCEVTQ